MANIQTVMAGHFKDFLQSGSAISLQHIPSIEPAFHINVDGEYVNYVESRINSELQEHDERLCASMSEILSTYK